MLALLLLAGGYVASGLPEDPGARGCPAGGCGAGAEEDEVAMLSQRVRVHSEALSGAAAGSRLSAASGTGHYRVEKADLSEKAMTDRERRMHQIIDEKFAHVKGPGSFLKSNVKPDNTWLQCSSIDWSTVTEDDLHLGTDIFEKMEEELGIKEYCWEGGEAPDDPTCLAIFAALEAIVALQKEFPEGPLFHNAFVTDWGQHASWSSGAVGNVSYSPMPPTAKVLNANGINGFALCDIVRSVVTISANQQSAGMCSYASPVAALSRKAPAKLIKMGIRLLWTGRHTPYVERPCDYVLDRQPGLVPWKGSGVWHPETTPAEVQEMSDAACTGNENDCKNGEGSPPQPLGLVHMWAQASISEYSLANFGSCDNRHTAELSYPGISEAAAEQIGSDLGGTDATQLWACNQFIDPVGTTCRNIRNVNVCGGWSDMQCSLLFDTPFDPVLQEQIENALLQNTPMGVSKATLESSVKALKEGSPEKGYFDRFIAGFDPFADTVTQWHNWYGFFHRQASVANPSFTEALLDEACRAPVALLAVASKPLDVLGSIYRIAAASGGKVELAPNAFSALDTPFYCGADGEKCVREMKQKIPSLATLTGIEKQFAEQFGTCDHSVYLESCDKEKNEYVIWTWGTTYTLPKAWLLGTTYIHSSVGRDFVGTYKNGMICSATLANQISFAEDVH